MVPILIVGSGCQTADDDTFRITAIEFDGDATITLTFSEPLAAVAGVDPNDFRLSVAQTSSYAYSYAGMRYEYAYTGYSDVARILDYSYYDDYVERFTFMEVTPGAAANQIVLRASEPLQAACDRVLENLEEFELIKEQYMASADLRFDAAVFLHYASGEIPIESEAGGVLGDIGADWVLSQELYAGREGYGFTQLAPKLRIPCK